MSLYKCIVLDAAGKKQKINRDAESKAELLDYLKLNRYIVIDVKAEDNSYSLGSSLGNFKK